MINNKSIDLNSIPWNIDREPEYLSVDPELVRTDMIAMEILSYARTGIKEEAHE